MSSEELIRLIYEDSLDRVSINGDSFLNKFQNTVFYISHLNTESPNSGLGGWLDEGLPPAISSEELLSNTITALQNCGSNQHAQLFKDLLSEMQAFNGDLTMDPAFGKFDAAHLNLGEKYQSDLEIYFDKNFNDCAKGF